MDKGVKLFIHEFFTLRSAKLVGVSIGKQVKFVTLFNFNGVQCKLILSFAVSNRHAIGVQFYKFIIGNQNRRIIGGRVAYFACCFIDAQ